MPRPMTTCCQPHIYMRRTKVKGAPRTSNPRRRSYGTAMETPGIDTRLRPSEDNPSGPIESTPVENMREALVTSNSTRQLWNAQEEQLLIDICLNQLPNLRYHDIAREIEQRTGRLRTAAAIKSRWYQIKKRPDVVSKISQPSLDQAQTRSPEVNPTSQNKSRYFTQAHDKILYSLCNNKAVLSWKYDIGPAFREKTGLEYDDNKIRLHWAFLKKKDLSQFACEEGDEGEQLKADQLPQRDESEPQMKDECPSCNHKTGMSAEESGLLMMPKEAEVTPSPMMRSEDKTAEGDTIPTIRQDTQVGALPLMRNGSGSAEGSGLPMMQSNAEVTPSPMMRNERKISEHAEESGLPPMPKVTPSPMMREEDKIAEVGTNSKLRQDTENGVLPLMRIVRIGSNDCDTEVDESSNVIMDLAANTSALTDSCQVPEEFQRLFREFLNVAKHTYNRKPGNRPPGPIPTDLILYASSMISSEYDKKPSNTSNLGWLNALTYAAARTIAMLVQQRNRTKPSYVKEKLWFLEKDREKARMKRTLELITNELQRRKDHRMPSATERKKMKLIFELAGARSTVRIRHLYQELTERVQLLDDRVNLRLAEQARKRVRKEFAQRPTLRILEKKKEGPDSSPEMERILEFWKPIIGIEKACDPEKDEYLRKWRREIQKRATYDGLMPDEEIEKEFEIALKRMKPWKATGPDGVHAAWWKIIPSAHEILKRLICASIKNGRLPWKWIAQGRTILIYKKGDPSDPANYRPITCLNTCYKAMTALLNRLILKYVEQGKIIPREQRALKPGEWACKHAMILDQAIAQDSIWRRKEIMTAWLDYRKAFDSVAHQYLIWLFKAMNLPPEIQTLLIRAMKHWKTSYQICGNKKKSPKIAYLNGIFQGDSLSPTLFAISVAPISYALNEFGPLYQTSYGGLYNPTVKMNHQFYVDDLKLYASTPADLTVLLDIVTRVSSIVGLNLNANKCAIMRYQPQGENGDVISNIAELGDKDTYQYLGIHQHLLQTDEGLELIKSRFIEVVEKIFSSNLTLSQKRLAYKTIAVAKMSYYYGMTNGARPRLQSGLKMAEDLDKEVRKLMVKHKISFKSSCTPRLYISTDYGGWGWTSLYDCFEDNAISTWSYLSTREDLSRVRDMFMRQAKRGKRNMWADGCKILEEYKIPYTLHQSMVQVGRKLFDKPTKLKRAISSQMQHIRDERRLSSWLSRETASRVLKKDLELDLSFLWLKKGLLSTLNARNVISVQECCLTTKAHPILLSNGRCRQCDSALETADHIVSMCHAWMNTLYIARHDSIARNIHYWLCKRYNIRPRHYSEAVPPIMEGDGVKILWNPLIQTKALMDHRKPDLVVFYNNEQRILIIEVSVAHMTGLEHQRQLKINRYTVNSLKQDNENDLPYKAGPNLLADMRERLRQEVEFLPFVIGTTGEIPQGMFEDILQKLRMKRGEALKLLERCQRGCIIGTSRIVRNHLSKCTK